MEEDLFLGTPVGARDLTVSPTNSSPSTNREESTIQIRLVALTATALSLDA
jgi:hypothetical protein